MASIGELKPKLGEKVTFAQTGEWYAGSTGTVIAIDRNDEAQPYLIGWKTPPSGQISSTVSDPRQLKNCVVINDYDSYPCNAWIHHSKEVVVTVHRDGMRCAGRHCGTYNEYAIPNQPDGKTYLCYSCMGRPACMR